MKDVHIISILEGSPFNSLSESELEGVRAHVAHCDECRRAYEAAQISALLLKERAAEVIEPSPFFQTRVLAALRERQVSTETPLSSLRRLWKAAGALVSMMACLVVVLIGLTIFNASPDSDAQLTEIATSQNVYSPEYVVIDRGDLDSDPLPYDQVLGMIYDSEDDDGN